MVVRASRRRREPPGETTMPANFLVPIAPALALTTGAQAAITIWPYLLANPPQ
jgi:hypothetical protein